MNTIEDGITTERTETLTGSHDRLRQLDGYWRAANYLTIGQIYLQENPLLREPLRAEHIKPRLLGHWGTSPGLSFIYAHLNRLIQDTDANVIYLTGPGHGGPAIVANVYLEGTYSEIYPDISQDNAGQCAVRGQYGPGNSGGKKASGYPEEEGAAHDSQTETFVALKLFVDNWRWQDVPFYLRTGKRLPRQASKIFIQFRAAPHRSFPAEASLRWQPSRLVLSIQPGEGIVLAFQAKYPGPKMQLRPVDMQFSYRESFDVPSPEAYETLLLDVMKNDPTLFMRADQVEAAWQWLMPVIDVWAQIPPSDFPNYAAGTWGPENAQAMLAQGDSWPLPTELVDQKKTKTNPKSKLAA